MNEYTDAHRRVSFHITLLLPVIHFNNNFIKKRCYIEKGLVVDILGQLFFRNIMFKKMCPLYEVGI